MSSDLKLELVEDSRMALKDKIEYPVTQSSASVNPMQYSFGTYGSSSQSVVVQVPSLDNLTDMAIFVSGSVTFNVAGTIAVLNSLISYGTTATPNVTFLNFPYNRMLQTVTCQINNASVTLNSSDIVPALLEYVSRDELTKSNCMTPTQLNNYGNYNQAYATSRGSIFANYLNSYDPKNVSNAAYPAIVSNSVGAVDAPGTGTITINFCEPILGLSPLLFGDHGSSIRGVNNIVLSMVLDSLGKRALKFVNNGTDDLAVTSIVYSNLKAECTFLTAKPFMLSKYGPRNVLEYCESDVYITPNNTILSVQNTKQTIQSNAVQLSSIPKAIIFYVRPLASAQNWYTSDYKFPITNVNVNFNSMNGLLSAASQNQLFRMNCKNGTQLNFLEWSGKANIGTVGGAAGVIQYASTCGGALCLGFGSEIQIPESYLAAGSLGQYTLSLSVTFENTIGLPVLNPPVAAGAAIPLELVLITISDGCFSTSSGISERYTSLLTKEAVMSVLTQEPKLDIGNHKSAEVENVGEVVSGGRRVKRHTHKKHHMRHGHGDGDAAGEADGEGSGKAFGEGHHRMHHARAEGKAFGEGSPGFGEARRVGRPRKSASGEARRALSRRVKF